MHEAIFKTLHIVITRNLHKDMPCVAILNALRLSENRESTVCPSVDMHLLNIFEDLSKDEETSILV